MTARARTTDPGTSHAAAASAESNVAASQRAVLDILHDALMPLTDEEITGYLRGQFSPSRVRTARRELEADGLVECAGTIKPPGKRTSCRVWIAKADAA
ncbi:MULTISPECIES: hypothetical protein [unclassified Microbacterium]|uniref:hypothetical protein n=1 Tax=unclassified Microbacterium TaxID=2609290 RepID=UPI0030166768